MRRQNRSYSNRTLIIVAGGVAAALLLLAVIAVASRAPGRPATALLRPQVEFFTTPTAPAAETPPTTPTTQPVETPSPTPTPQVTQYTIVEGDTLWDIAVKFGLSIDALIAVNPNMNPDLVRPGDVINLPGPNVVIPTRSPAAQSSAPARVAVDGSGLRLRAGPSTNDEVITKLAPGTALTVLKRTTDNQWLQVATPQGTEGWVMCQFVDLNIDLAQVPAVQGSSPAAAAEAPAASQPAQPAVHQQAPVDDPTLSGLGARAQQIYAQGQALGNHPNVFSLIGDSNTANTAFLAPFDWGAFDLGPYGYLQDTINYFHGSYSRGRIAARGGFNTTKELDPGNAPDGCGGNSSLGCEIQNNRPIIAFVLLGTGDQHTWQDFEGRYRQIVEYLIGQGVIPVLMTKGDDLEATDSNAPYDYINSIIRRLSGEYGVPLLNVRQAMAALPNRGFDPDGFHFNKPPDGQVANFNTSYLSYGYNMLNLTAMRALDAIRRQVLR